MSKELEVPGVWVGCDQTTLCTVTDTLLGRPATILLSMSAASQWASDRPGRSFHWVPIETEEGPQT